jgi:hypothetical protein
MAKLQQDPLLAKICKDCHTESKNTKRVYRNIPQSIPSPCLTYLLVCLGFFHNIGKYRKQKAKAEQYLSNAMAGFLLTETAADSCYWEGPL